MNATAFVVGPPDGPSTALIDMARRLDFVAVLPYGGIAQAEQQAALTPICFFLFAPVPDVGSLHGVADAIRFSSGRRIRFCPLIYFSDSPHRDTVTRCINMGFDDVITQPFTQARVSARIHRQIGKPLIYYETASYFGPDRRERVTGPNRAAETRLGGKFRRLEIVRDIADGVNVLRDEPSSQQVG